VVNAAELQRRYEFDVYGKRPPTIVRGAGSLVWDDRGREYVDCTSGHGVANLGHAHPAIVAAVAEQAGRLITLANTFCNDRRAALMQRLVGLAPPALTRVFLCNSGTESVEAAIKFARGATGRTDFVCAEGGFHGRTCGALSATFRPEYREPFEPLVPGFAFVPYNDFVALAARVTERTAGVILEPIQGESGVRLGDADYFARVRRLCDERGALLVLDEVQTGFCRTGTFFAHERLGVAPDLLCLAKAIAGGLPLGAVLCSERVRLPVGRHGSTFGGNPLCCAAALAAIGVMLEQKLADRARDCGDRLVRRLRERGLPRVREIRHAGLMIGIELHEPALPRILALIERGVLTFPAGSTVIRVFPPLTIEDALLDRVGDALEETLRAS
jgi:acetylornithine/LysW-gamma-L-lysine aminotransferase